jgi:hypothetical protein
MQLQGLNSCRHVATCEQWCSRILLTLSTASNQDVPRDVLDSYPDLTAELIKRAELPAWLNILAHMAGMAEADLLKWKASQACPFLCMQHIRLCEHSIKWVHATADCCTSL